MADEPNCGTNILSDDHVAHLGEELFSRYLIAVEMAGTLLLVALVGAIAMVSHERPPTGQIAAAAIGPAAARTARNPSTGTSSPAYQPKEPTHG